MNRIYNIDGNRPFVLSLLRLDETLLVCVHHGAIALITTVQGDGGTFSEKDILIIVHKNNKRSVRNRFYEATGREQNESCAKNSQGVTYICMRNNSRHRCE